MLVSRTRGAHTQPHNIYGPHDTASFQGALLLAPRPALLLCAVHVCMAVKTIMVNTMINAFARHRLSRRVHKFYVDIRASQIPHLLPSWVSLCHLLIMYVRGVSFRFVLYNGMEWTKFSDKYGMVFHRQGISLTLDDFRHKRHCEGYRTRMSREKRAINVPSALRVQAFDQAGGKQQMFASQKYTYLSTASA